MRAALEEALGRNPTSGYLRYHLPRYVSLLDAACAHRRDGTGVLDIGRSLFTEVLLSEFDSVDTLGFAPDSTSDRGSHYEFDLNDSRDPERWRGDLPAYDVVVFAEVIEHLYTSPNHVLAFLRTLLKENGVLLLQTPNAVAIHKRLKPLLGKNPYELIREDDTNPGHFREYTRSELAAYLTGNGFAIESFSYENYFDFQYSDHADESRLVRDGGRRRFNLLFSLLPGCLKPGMFFVARKT